LPNGDVVVAHAPKSKAKDAPAADELTLLRNPKPDGPADATPFAVGLNRPLGVCLVGPTLFVGNTDAVLAFAYIPGQQKLESPRKVLDLPAGGYNNHWTRNVVAGKNGKLYVSVGSASNVAENGTGEELLRANILEVNPDGTGLRVFASGLRNPVGMDWEPSGGRLWTAVNERDHLGDDLGRVD
jgi:glucose/arabinose dehydrogenase